MIDKTHLKNYLNVCKKNDITLINNMLIDIKNVNTNDSSNYICNKYLINNDEFESLNHIIKVGGSMNNSDLYQDVYFKYHILKGGFLGSLLKVAASGVKKKLKGTIAAQASKLKDGLKKSVSKHADQLKTQMKQKIKGSINKQMDSMKQNFGKHMEDQLSSSSMGSIIMKQIDSHIDDIFEKMKPKIQELINEEIQKT
jgi:hypothetical protein